MKKNSDRIEYFVSVLCERLEQEKASIAKQWQNPEGTSTRHFVIDELLSSADADAIYSAFPRNGDGFFSRESFREKKKTNASLDQYDAILADITYAFQDPSVVRMVGDAVGFEMMEPDASLYAGGLSMMFPGDYLNPHIDNSHDATRSKYRRLNLLYYVSPEWSEKNGGNFELWSDDRRTPKTIVARQNRLVVMETNKCSWHSVNKVAADKPRCCVSNYYFSTKSPAEVEYFHVTSFSGRPEEPVKRAVGIIDNALRNLVSKTLKIGRGKNLANKTDE